MLGSEVDSVDVAILFTPIFFVFELVLYIRVDEFGRKAN